VIEFLLGFFRFEKVLPQQKKPPTAPGSRSIFISQPYYRCSYLRFESMEKTFVAGK